jgi:hypothetical protein
MEPRKDDDSPEVRKWPITVYLSEYERQVLREHCLTIGISMSTFCRMTAMRAIGIIP